jgi:hydrogenase maturation factor
MKMKHNVTIRLARRSCHHLAGNVAGWLAIHVTIWLAGCRCRWLAIDVHLNGGHGGGHLNRNTMFFRNV